MKARVTISGGNPMRLIDVSMEEYRDFIEEQAQLLDIRTKDSPPNSSKISCNFDKGKLEGEMTGFNVVIPRYSGMAPSKTIIDELMKELAKQNKRNGGTK